MTDILTQIQNNYFNQKSSISKEFLNNAGILHILILNFRK
jgi:hypothetical protein